MVLVDPEALRRLTAVQIDLYNCATVAFDILPYLCTVFIRADNDVIKMMIERYGNNHGVMELVERYKQRAEDLSPFIAGLRELNLEKIALVLEGNETAEEATKAQQPDFGNRVAEIQSRLRYCFKRYCSIRDEDDQHIMYVDTDWVPLRIESQRPMSDVVGEDPEQDPRSYWENLLPVAEDLRLFRYHDICQIVGEAGYGKTAFMTRLAFDWAAGNLPQFDMILYADRCRSKLETQRVLDVALEYLEDLQYLTKPQVNFLQSNTEFTKRLAERAIRLLLVVDSSETNSPACRELEANANRPVAFDYNVLFLTKEQYNSHSAVASILPWTCEHVKRCAELYFRKNERHVDEMMRCYESQPINVKQMLEIPRKCCQMCAAIDGEDSLAIHNFLQECHSSTRFVLFDAAMRLFNLCSIV